MHSRYQTGSNHLHRVPFFNENNELDMDIPDGDVEVGRRVYSQFCSGCHNLYDNVGYYPRLHNVFGKTAGTQKGFKYYSRKNRMISYQWSKQRLFYMIENPQQVFGVQSNMTFNGLSDIYERASVIEYLHYMRIHTSKIVKPEWINELSE